MSEIKNISVEEAAIKYSGYDKRPGYNNVANRTISNRLSAAKEAFKAGAEWQKEQDKEIREALKKIIEWHDIHNAISFIDEEIITNAKRLL